VRADWEACTRFTGRERGGMQGRLGLVELHEAARDGCFTEVMCKLVRLHMVDGTFTSIGGTRGFDGRLAQRGRGLIPPYDENVHDTLENHDGILHVDIDASTSYQ